MNCWRNKRAFTLIEVLVVVAIIGIISAVIYANFGDSRNRAQNDVLRNELKSTQLAIELYRAQHNTYPGGNSCGNGCTSAGGGARCVCRSNIIADTYIPGLAPDFIESLPDDDDYGPSCDFQYIYDVGNGATTYKLSAVRCVEFETVATNDELARCPDFCGANGVCNPDNSVYQQTFAIYADGYECE